MSDKNKPSQPFEIFACGVLYRGKPSHVQVLLVQPIGKGRKRWQFPQVIVSVGENFEDAAAHEVAEETGVPAKDLSFLGYVDYPNRRLYCFYGRASDKAQAASERLEIREARFFGVKEAMPLLDKRQQQLLSSLISTLTMLKEIA